ncbi:polysaccharide biosynthesis tyrosine autokinase [bacterium]|nr:polysaccharide biosynthesis tyrosine autokinase [FCB group bacterium]MBL7190084.1 polysaccharide biosynthesis tyrosine autokinase [bacterium]
MEIRKLWEIILRRKWIIIQAFIVIFAIVLTGTLLQTPTYYAECNVLIEQQGTQEALLRSIGLEGVSEMLFSMNLGQKSSIVAVEIMKLMTKPILDKVVERMDLRNEKGELIPGPSLKITNPTFFWYPLYGLSAKPHRLGNMIIIQGYSPDPQQAVDFCNTITQIYMLNDIEKKHKETAEAARFAEEQSIKAKADWNEAKRKLKEYQEAEGLVDFSYESILLINTISDLRADQAMLELSLHEAEMFGGEIIDPYMIGGSSLSNAGQIGQLKTSLSQQESQLESELTKYTGNHPSVIALKQQIQDLNQKLITEKEIFEETGSERYKVLQEQINEYRKKLEEFPEKLYIMAQLTLQSETYQKMYETLLDMKYRLNISKAMQISKLSLLEPSWKAKVYAPDIELNMIIGVVLGLLVGFGLAFLIEYLDDTIKDGETLQAQFNLPLLGTIPLIGKKDEKIIDAMLDSGGRHRSQHFLNESFNIFSYNIKLSSIDSPTRHVMITSSSPGEGKTSISCNLAINMARKGKKVVLIDSDFPRPNIYKIFNLSNDKGLTDLLMGETTIEEVTQSCGVENMHVITTGPKPPSTSILFESQQMKDFIKELEQRYDFIIFDTPPILSINDPVILGSYVDKTILVVAANEVSRSVVKMAISTMKKSHINLVGAVLNKFRAEGSHYYYYYYYHTSDEGNGFKKIWRDGLSIIGINKRRRHRRRTPKIPTNV